MNIESLNTNNSTAHSRIISDDTYNAAINIIDSKIGRISKMKVDSGEQNTYRIKTHLRYKSKTVNKAHILLIDNMY